jgi:hypothetical protein
MAAAHLHVDMQGPAGIMAAKEDNGMSYLLLHWHGVAYLLPTIIFVAVIAARV